MPNLLFIQGHIQDVDQLSWLSREFFQESLMKSSTEEIADSIDRLFSRVAIMDELNDPDTEHWIIQLESKGIGYLRIKQNKPERQSACLDRLILLQAYWTKERLESLLTFAEYRTEKLGMLKLFIAGWQVLHPAAKAFEQLGYKLSNTPTSDNLDSLPLKPQRFVKSVSMANASS